MKNTFEIYVTSDTVTASDWQKFYSTFESYSGMFSFGKLRLIVQMKGNLIRLFVQCDKNLASMSNDLEGMIIRDVDEKELDIPKATSKETFMNFVTGGTLLDLKEKVSLKTNKDLETAVFDIRTVINGNAIVKAHLYFKKPGGGYSIANKTLTSFPSHLLPFDFGGDNATYMKKKLEKYLDIEKSLHLFSSEKNLELFEIEGFPYLKGKYYSNLNSYDFNKHSFIVGASGSGKSKLISLLVDRIASSQYKDQYSVIVVDPHNALKEEFLHIENSSVIEFKEESVGLFNDAPKDIQAESELTSVLFKSLIGDQFNARLERVLKYSLYTLFTAKSMDLDTLKRFLTDTDLRNQMVEHVKDFVPGNVSRFFGADYNEIKAQYYNEAVLPIIALVDEMSLQEGMVSSSDGPGNSIAMNVKNHFLTVFSLNKVSMGEKVVKTVAGLIIQQLFLLAQSGDMGKKMLLIVDEVSVVQNPALAQILSEARKFGLTIILTQQYFGQIEKNLQDAIFANTYNYYAFRVSEEDARALEGNLNIELPKIIAEEGREKGLKEPDMRAKIMTELNPRQCLIRLSSNDKLNPCVKARTVDADFAKANEKVAEELKKYDKDVKLPEKFHEKDTSVEALPQLNEAPSSMPNADLPTPNTEKPADMPSFTAPVAPGENLDLDSIIASAQSDAGVVTDEPQVAPQVQNLSNGAPQQPVTDDETASAPELVNMAEILKTGVADGVFAKTHTENLKKYDSFAGYNSDNPSEEFINISMLLAEHSSSPEPANVNNTEENR